MRRTIISSDEYKDISEKASAVKYFLNNPRFQFIREYMTNTTDDVEKRVVNNDILEVREERTITDNIKRIFITPKKPQIDELKGAYKWINKFFLDMEFYVNKKTEVDDAIEKKRVIVK